MSLSNENNSTFNTELGLRDYAKVIWRQKLVVIIVTLIAVGTAIFLDAGRTPVYQATATLLLSPPLSQAINAPSAGANTVDAPTAVKVIQSRATAKAAAAFLHAPYVPGAVAAQEGTTNVLTVSVQATNPAYAAKVANAYVNAYIAQQHTNTINSLLDASSQISARIGPLDSELTAVQAQIASITSQEVPASTSSGATGPPVATPTQAAQLAALTQRQTTLTEEEAAFKQQIGQLQIAANLAGGGGQLVTPAGINPIPISPNKSRDRLLAFSFGLALGIGLALIRDLLDDRIRSEEDVRRAVGGIPALGLIPNLPDWKDRSQPRVASLEGPTSAIAEAYRELRTALQFMSLESPIRYLLIVSPVAGDGKTTTAANLAVNMAQAGQRVVAVCCDLRRPRLHEFFGLSNDVGMTSVLLGNATLAEALQEVEATDNLRILAAGPPPPNPSELLSTGATAELLKAVGQTADLVIIDTPPILPVTDASVMAAQCDAVLLVCAAHQTHRRAAKRAVELLGRVDARLVGVVVNNIERSKSGYGYGYGYAYKYGYGYDGRYNSTNGQRKRHGSPHTNGKVPASVDEAASDHVAG